MARRLNDWLTGYLEYTQAHEATDKLHLWCAITILSAALKRQVFMNRGYYTLYPNMYVLIVAESAKARKSLAMDLAVHMLKDSVPDITYISGSMTPEGLVKHLSKENVFGTVTNNGVKTAVYTDSHFIIHSDELAETFGYDRQRASRFTILLTKIYGAQSEHTHTLASEKQVVLHNLYPVFLAGTDQHNLRVLPEEAIGGLIGRTIFVNESTKKRSIAWPSQVDVDKAREMYKLLKEDLYTISQLRGEIKPTARASEYFRAWYEDSDRRPTGDRRVDAFRERCHDTAVKLSIILALSRSDELIVHSKQMEMAIKYIEAQESEFKNVSDWAAASQYNQNRARFIEHLAVQGGASTRAITMRILKISLDEMILLENSLEQEKTIEMRAANKTMYYKVRDNA